MKPYIRSLSAFSQKGLLLYSVIILLSQGCGSKQSSSGKTSDQAAPAKIRVGYIPISECAHLYVGIAKKYFEDEKLDVDLQPMKGGAVILPALQTGDIEIGFANVVSLIVQNSQLPSRSDNSFVALVGGSYERPGHNNHALLYKNGANLRVADLGKPGIRIAVNTTRNIEELMLRRFISARGLSDNQLELVPIAFPDMWAALERGDVQVASVVEPYIAPALRGDKFSLLAQQYLAVSSNTIVATYAVKRGWLQKNPDTAARFKRAFNKADDFIRQHDAETREILGTFTRISKGDLPIVGMPAFEPTVSREAVIELIHESLKFGFIQKEPNPDDIVTP